MDPGRHRDFRAVRPHNDFACQRARHAAHTGAIDRPRHARRLSLPPTRHSNSRRRHYGAFVTGRHLRRHVGCGILHQQSDTDGVGRFRRFRGRRRDRHDREHVPQPGARLVADARGSRRRATDRLHRDLHQSVARRRVHSASVHGRYRRAAAPGIFRYPCVRHRGVDRRFANGDAHDLRPFRALGPEPRCNPARPRGGRLDGLGSARLRPYARHCAQASLSHHAGPARHHCRNGEPLHQDPQRLFSAG